MKNFSIITYINSNIFKDKIKKAIDIKLKTYLDKAREFSKTDLPLCHYYENETNNPFRNSQLSQTGSYFVRIMQHGSQRYEI